jgi:Cu2+-exporting ATPase
MVPNLLRLMDYSAFAIPLAAGALNAWGILFTPALGAVLMSVSTLIAAINGACRTMIVGVGHRHASPRPRLLTTAHPCFRFYPT